MRKVLLLTYDYPPCSAPGAALRSRKLVKYLPEFGWDAAVICRGERGFPGADEIRGTGPSVDRVPTPIPPWFSYQLGAWAWAARIYPVARKSIKDLAPDLIYASCPPFPHALAAVRLARETGIPLVADFRDAWSLEWHADGGPIKQFAKLILARRVYPHLERKVIEFADAVLLSTTSMHREYARLYAGSRQRMHFVPNGFDDADFREHVECPRRETPLLLYCGRFSGIGGRSPDLLLHGMRMAIDAGIGIELEILGDDSAMLRRAVERFGLEGHVRTHPAAPHRDAIRAMRRADILVVQQAPARSRVTPVAGKTYEYLRSGRPILALVPPGDNADLVRRFAAQYAIVTGNDPASLVAAVRDLLGRAGSVPSTGPDPEFVGMYARNNIARQIAAIFDRVVAGRGATGGERVGNQHGRDTFGPATGCGSAVTREGVAPGSRQTTGSAGEVGRRRGYGGGGQAGVVGRSGQVPDHRKTAEGDERTV